MKKTTYLAFSLLLFGCSAIKQLNNEEIKTEINCSNIFFEGKSPLIEVEIDNVKSKFILDTGAGISALMDSTIVPNFQGKKMGSLGSSMGADRKKIKNRFLSVQLKTKLFNSENKVLAFINTPISDCAKTKRSFTGILGMDVFLNENQLIQLDFTNNKVCNITKNQFLLELNDKNYTKIPSECKRDQIFVFLTIEGKEYKFKLDTGYTGTITIPSTGTTTFSGNKMELEGTLHQTVSGYTKGLEIYYEKIPIVFGQEKLSSKLTVSNSIKAQNIGIEFIKGFDWLIDYNNNIVYFKKNDNKIPFEFSRKISYYAKANKENLVIVTKEKSQTKFNLNDQIISVNDQKVTHDNICEMQYLLNKTEDWNQLNIEVVSSNEK
jgi:hypothetical protein